MSEESSNNEKELLEVSDSFLDILSRTSPALENLDWSADRKSMNIKISLVDKKEETPSTYAYLSNFSNFEAEDLVRTLASEILKNTQQQEEDVVDAEYREVSDEDESKGSN